MLPPTGKGYNPNIKPTTKISHTLSDDSIHTQPVSKREMLSGASPLEDESAISDVEARKPLSRGVCRSISKQSQSKRCEDRIRKTVLDMCRSREHQAIRSVCDEGLIMISCMSAATIEDVYALYLTSALRLLALRELLFTLYLYSGLRP